MHFTPFPAKVAPRRDDIPGISNGVPCKNSQRLTVFHTTKAHD
jgi:hypothetical protein